MDNEEKKPKASNKEIMMIIIVVVLAFGLTVAGIVYLTNFLIGDKPQDTPQTSQSDPAVPQAPEDNMTDPAATDPVVRFTDNGTAQPMDNNTATPSPVTTPPATPPAVVTTPPPTATPPMVTTPPVATTPPPVTTQPVASIPATIPTASPTKGTYQLQLSAFKSEDKAIAEAKKYIQEYPDIYVMRADLGSDGVWFRVRCCSADSQDELTRIKGDLERKYKITPYVVKVQ